MRVSAVILAVLVSLTLGIDLTHKDCGSSATITKVFSPDCEDQVCKLKKGHTYNMKISFKPNGKVTAMKAKLYGVIAGIPVPFPLPVQDGCEACENTCPIEGGTEVTMTESLKVQPSYPALKLTSRWKLEDESANGDIVCVEIPVVIVN